MSTPLLTIGIPTFNRAALLMEALVAIATQIDASTSPLVEVMVSDNASPDDTPATVAQMAARYPLMTLSYYRQPRNLGADGNIASLVSRATGEFVYLVSDDDILLPGAIATILRLLREDPSLDALCLNMRSFEQDPSEARPLNIPTDRDRRFGSRDDILEYLGTYLTFISVLVFRRSLIAGRDYSRRIGTSFLQSYVFLDVLAGDGGVLATREPFLAARSNNTGGYSFFQAFVTGFAELLHHAESLGYSRAATRSVLARHGEFVFGFVKVFKLRGAFGSLTPDYGDGLRRIVKVYWRQPLFLARIVPLILLPRALVQPVYRLSRVLRKARA
jgi:abequosyltransferase